MKRKILLIISFSILISLTACTNPQPEKDKAEVEHPDFIQVNVEARELLTRSEEISNMVVELYGIDDASTIIFNEDAYIAVIMAFDQEFTDELKNLIIHQAKEKDALIENIYVTNDEKIFRQIDDIVFNLLQGESYDDQVKEINKIARKIKK